MFHANNEINDVNAKYAQAWEILRKTEREAEKNLENFNEIMQTQDGQDAAAFVDTFGKIEK